MLYILVKSNFHSTICGCESSSFSSWQNLEEKLQESCALAADYYAENTNIPIQEIWKDCEVIGVSTYRPQDSGILWFSIDQEEE